MLSLLARDAADIKMVVNVESVDDIIEEAEEWLTKGVNNLLAIEDIVGILFEVGFVETGIRDTDNLNMKLAYIHCRGRVL